VGLDVHPDSFTAAALLGAVAREAELERLSDKVALPQLEQWVQRHTEAEDVLVMEATGNCWEVVERLERIGRRALVLDSVKVGKIAKSYCITDKTSAVQIARVYLSGLSRDVWVPDPTTRTRREVFSAYQQADGDVTRSTNRIKGYLNEHCIRLPKSMRITSPKARGWIESARDWNPIQRLLLQQAFEELEQAEGRRQELRTVMAREILQSPELLRLLRIFGLRHITVYAIAAYIGDVRRFRTPKKLVAYIGLNPRVQSSGEHEGRRFLQGNGRKELRRVLIEAAHCVFHHKRASNPLYRWAHHLSYRKGRKHAVVGVARKIVTAIWYLLMGLFTPLQEASSTLRYKIRVLARYIGIETLRTEGYRVYDDYINEKIKILTQTT
jgi:transposase